MGDDTLYGLSDRSGRAATARPRCASPAIGLRVCSRVELELLDPPLPLRSSGPKGRVSRRGSGSPFRGATPRQATCSLATYRKLGGGVRCHLGASSGIGEAACSQERRKGVRGGGKSAAQPRRRGLCEPETAFAIRSAMAKTGQVAAMIAATAEQFGGIGVLYGNEGDRRTTAFGSHLEEAWSRVGRQQRASSYAKQAFRVCMSVGSSVITSRRSSRSSARHREDLYTRRGAVSRWTRSCGAVRAHDGVRVHALCPGRWRHRCCNFLATTQALEQQRSTGRPAGSQAAREVVSRLFLAATSRRT